MISIVMHNPVCPIIERGIVVKLRHGMRITMHEEKMLTENTKEEQET